MSSPSKSGRPNKRPAGTAAAGEPAKRSKTIDVSLHAPDAVESDLSDLEDHASPAEPTALQAQVNGNCFPSVPVHASDTAAPLSNRQVTPTPNPFIESLTVAPSTAPVETVPAANGVDQGHEIGTPSLSVAQPAPAVDMSTTAGPTTASASEDLLILPSATTEARAVGLLRALGVEPGVLVGLDLNALKMATMSAASVVVPAPVVSPSVADAAPSVAVAAPSVADHTREAQLAGATAVVHQRLPALVNASAPVRDVPGPFAAARTEAEAAANLNALGFEPAALVGLDVQALNALHSAVLRGKLSDAAASPEQSSAGPSNNKVVAASLPHRAQPSASSMSRAHHLAGLAATNIPEERVAHLTDVELGRVHAIVAYTDNTRNIYPLESVAVGMDWGVATSFNNMANYICQKGTSKPITFWVVGAVTFGHWFNKEGLAADRVALGIQPLSTTASASCKTLLDTLCVPRNSSYVAAGFGADQIKATRWMTVKAQNGKPATVLMFTDVYNASSALRDKTSMEKLAVDTLKPHDLVLVEARIGRHTTDPATKGKPRTMDNFQAFFNLESLYLLKSAPSESVILCVVTYRPYNSSIASDVKRPFNTWLCFAKEKDGDLSVPSLHKIIKADRQGWSRIRRLLRLPQPNCIIIFAYAGPAKARDDLQSALCLAYVDDVQSATALSTLATLLGDSPVRSIGALYDSSPNTIDWYYEAFGAIDGGGSPLNLIASGVFGKDIKGDVLLTVTTPGTTERVQRPIVGRDVIKTLWHYLSMELDAGRIARERALERIKPHSDLSAMACPTVGSTHGPFSFAFLLNYVLIGTRRGSGSILCMSSYVEGRHKPCLVCGSYFDLGSNTMDVCDYTWWDSRPRIRFLTGINTLSLVCSRWRAIIVSTPTFWTSWTVTPRTPPPALRIWAQRMKEAPIRLCVVLQLHDRPDGVDSELVYFGDMCSFIVQVAPQCRELSIYASDHPVLTAFSAILVGRRFPMLEDLSVVLLGEYVYGRLQHMPVVNRIMAGTLLGANPPTQLRLSGFCLAWNSVEPYGNLTTLLLHRIDRRSAPTLSDLQLVFRTAQRLRRLSISEVHCTGALGDLHPIILPWLQSFHLHISANAPIAALMALFRAPVLRQLDLSAAPGADELVDDELAILLECAPMVTAVTHLSLKGYYFPWQGAAILERLVPLVTHLDLGCGSRALCYTLTYCEPSWPKLRCLEVMDADFSDAVTLCTKYVLERLTVCNSGRREYTEQQQTQLQALVPQLVIEPDRRIKWFLRDEL
ncbi:hypothetical protein K438DRAFT_1775030 [Mycena galopus ATCC 62051]|nr:hypothetical protein K438DRAFT_1775030 [Mycena galopus ATCC 62051]